MHFKYIVGELKKGILETSKYILSHHKKEDYHKCYLFKIKNRRIAVCARCLGVYVGIIMGAILFSSQIFNKNLYYLSIGIFPMFALVDWSVSTFTKYKSNNFFRMSSGFFLGIAYIFGLILLLRTPLDYFIIAIGLFYLITALLLLSIQNFFPKKSNKRELRAQH